MNVVDSSGWLEYFGKGTNGQVFAPLIRNTNELVVPTICIYEVFKRIAVQRDEEDALKAIGWMSLGNIIDLTQEIALHAAELSIHHRLSMADSIILATTIHNEAVLWTQDEHFAGLENVEFVKKG